MNIAIDTVPGLLKFSSEMETKLMYSVNYNVPKGSGCQKKWVTITASMKAPPGPAIPTIELNTGGVKLLHFNKKL